MPWGSPSAFASVHAPVSSAFVDRWVVRGAPARAVQELAEHEDLTTTRYTHLSLAAIDSAVRLLAAVDAIPNRGNTVVTGSTEFANSSW
jgi:hypothetical protein